MPFVFQSKTGDFTLQISEDAKLPITKATSFSLYTSNFIDYDAQKRAPGTHWKVVYCSRKSKKMLKAKLSYNSYEEAVEACNEYTINHPEDLDPMTAYKCDYCGKWHIGHER